MFFFNKGSGDTGTATPRPSYVAEDDIHYTAPIDEPLNIVVSTDLVKEILFQFARSRSNEPYVCIETGVNPLTYKPTEEDKEKMLAADLVLYTGLGMEPGLEDLIEKISDKVRCEALSGILEKEYQDQLIPSKEYKKGYDPHFWWNPRIWEKVIRSIVDILGDLDPDFEFNYGSIFIRYGQSLSLLDRRYIESWTVRLAEERKILVTLHPAFTYFGEKYGYKTMSLYTPESPDNVSQARRKTVADYIIKNNVPAIFPEVGFPMTEIDALHAEVKKMGNDVKIAEPLYSYFLGGDGSKDHLYLTAGRTQMDRIYYGLKLPEDPDMPEH